MKVGILFDLDGTLLDTLADLTDATNYALGQFGCPERSLEYVRSVVGNGALRQITLSLPGDTQLDPQQVLAVYKNYYRQHCNVKTAPYPGVVEALEALKSRYPVAIVTNKPHAMAAALGEVHFPGVYTLGETADIARKPAADMLQKAMQEIGVDACVYVGDSEVDLRTAENAGAPCLSVLWGFRSREDLEQAGAVHLCRRPEDMAAMIDALARSL